MTRSELGAFLRARRDRITPAQAGIGPFPGARRVPGLRREELAVLAGVSPDYYSRLEQGRQANVSEGVLNALARALRMSEVEAAHMWDLAGPHRRRPPAEPVRPQRPDPGLMRVMTTLDHVPTLLLGRRAEVLAVNALLTDVLGRALTPGESFARFLLQDPLARERIGNWTTFAEQAVAGLRRETARHPHDRVLRELIEELRSGIPQVETWWNDQAVRDYASTTKVVVHPQAGELRFEVEHVMAPLELDQHLVVYTVQPDSYAARMLPLLRSWATNTDVADRAVPAR